MKVKITYTPEEENAARATLDTLRAMYPAARVHESAKKAGVSAVFLTVIKPESRITPSKIVDHPPADVV